MTPTERQTLRNLRAECKRTGASLTIDRDSGWVDARVTAPQGQRLGDLHEFVDGCHKGWEPDYQDLLDRLRAAPPELCDAIDCDWCADGAAE